jgi:hypothetical protein
MARKHHLSATSKVKDRDGSLPPPHLDGLGTHQQNSARVNATNRTQDYEVLLFNAVWK